jgi:hypothetical protein
MTSDDQMEFELTIDDHLPVTEDNVRSILAIIQTGHKQQDYEACVKFLKPNTLGEFWIIRNVINGEK